MLGYKVYYDGEKFVAENVKSQVCTAYTDHPVKWAITYEGTETTIKNLTESCKLNEADVKEDTDLLLRKCKDCGEWFILSASNVHYFKARMLNIPCRCEKCRNKRRIRG